MTTFSAMRNLAPPLVLLWCGACGGTAETLLPSFSGDQSSPPASTGASSATLLPTPEGSPTEFTTSVFAPSFVVEVPASWTVAERASDVAQIFVRCDTCPHGGEENAEITLDMTYADLSVEEVIVDLQQAAGIDPGEASPADVGTLTGLWFVANRSETTDVRFGATDYGSEPFGLPIEVYALTLGGQTATVFVDPHQAQGAEAEAFMVTAREILSSLRPAG